MEIGDPGPSMHAINMQLGISVRHRPKSTLIEDSDMIYLLGRPSLPRLVGQDGNGSI